MDFVLGGLAGCSAGLFSNPLEVIKTRLQLQGELQARSATPRHYTYIWTSIYTIARHEGVIALQKGLVSQLYYQFCMNSVRLGLFSKIKPFVKDDSGKSVLWKKVVGNSCCGGAAACVASPFYLLKTQLQAQAGKEIAVGFQHKHQSFRQAFLKQLKAGPLSLWRGALAGMWRTSIGSCVQLTVFDEFMERFPQGYFSYPWLQLLLASSASAVCLTIVMTPLDVVSTRIYNQPTDASHKGLYYSGLFDCFKKVFMKEGFLGFYKGITAAAFRIIPHTMITLYCLEKYHNLYDKRKIKYFQN